MNEKLIREAIEDKKRLPGALLPILHEIQDKMGYIPETAVPVIAGELNLSRAEVHGVISFYAHFRQSPPNKTIVQICQAESCQAMGSAGLADRAKKSLGCGFHENSKDGLFSLEPVYCLGLCHSSPAVMVGNEGHAGMSPEKLDALLEEIRRAS